MRLFDLDRWSETYESLSRNKARSFLTAFGIFWGIFMLIFLMGGGQGFQRLMSRTFEGAAQNSCYVFPGETTIAYKGMQSQRTWQLDINDVERLKKKVSRLETVTPIIQQWSKTFQYDSKKANGTMRGVRSDYINIENPKIGYGRFINETDVIQKRKVCVIGKRIKEELFPDTENPCGRYIKLDSIYYRIVGVSKSNTNVGGGGNTSETAFIPFTTMQEIYHLGDNISFLTFTVKKGYTVAETQDEVGDIIKEAHLIAPNDKQAVFLFNIELLFQMVESLFNGMSFLVWMIGIGTLISGAIGVSNIMMVTIRERTIEIGIRRAIGAKPSDIVKQIMAESIILTILAGVSGIFFAVLLLNGVEMIVSTTGLDINFQISFTLALVASLALAILGGLAGMAPSLRALSIKPIDAIRSE